jgi:hypothetical protein
MSRKAPTILAFCALAACTGAKPDDASTGIAEEGGPGDTGGEEDTGSDPSATSGVVTMTTAETSGPGTSESDGGGEESGGCQFICPGDTQGGPDTQCDVWAQDCMEGEKCAPWANDGGNAWNATKCVPIDANPGQPGDPCTVEGSGVSGLDSCDASAMCWNVDPETNMGTCVAFCLGTQDNYSCEDPAASCVIVNEGVLILCLPVCDPLLQNCMEGEACYPMPANDFACVPDASGPDLGTYGDPCEYINACDPGLFCGDPSVVPGCAGAAGCCSEFCDMSSPDPNAECQGAAEGQECTAWYAEGEVPPGYENVGACVIPM